MFLYFHETDLFPYEPIPRRWMIFYAFLSFLFFLLVDRTTRSMLKLSTTHDLKGNWLKQNTLISFIHSAVCSVLLIIASLRAPEMFDDPLSHINYFNYALIAFSIGYFCWDFVDCWQNSSASTLAILMHHVLVLSFLSHILFHTRNIGWGLFALSLEINSVFLHARRLLRWYSPISSSASFKKSLKLFIDLGNYLTFIIFRFGVTIYGLSMLCIQRNRLHPIIHAFTVITVSGIGILNLVLFYRLVKNQFKQKSKTRQDKSTEGSILMTANHVLLPT